MNINILIPICYFLTFQLAHARQEGQNAAAITHESSACAVTPGSQIIFRSGYHGSNRLIARGTAPNQTFRTSNLLGYDCRITVINGRPNTEYEINGVYNIDSVSCPVEVSSTTLNLTYVITSQTSGNTAHMICSNSGRTEEPSIMSIRRAFPEWGTFFRGTTRSIASSSTSPHHQAASLMTLKPDGQNAGEKELLETPHDGGKSAQDDD